ncbi:MAG: hypothetical protein N2513_09600 [Deltaproteobacteria bacterium]|nr:hypothetical protein [Deltaproteobacteria bacterium]
MINERGFHERVKQALEEIKPCLEELAEGYVELIETDEIEKKVKLRLIGGKLH